MKHGDTSNYTGTSQASTCSMTGGEMSASCCSSMTHSPCSNNCSLQTQDRPKYLNLKPIYVRDVSREQVNSYSYKIYFPERLASDWTILIT